MINQFDNGIDTSLIGAYLYIDSESNEFEDEEEDSLIIFLVLQLNVIRHIGKEGLQDGEESFLNVPGTLGHKNLSFSRKSPARLSTNSAEVVPIKRKRGDCHRVRALFHIVAKGAQE